MSHKEFNCGEKTCRLKTGEYGRRTVLSGYDGISRMALNNARARLIAEIVEADEYAQHEFSSYYYGSQNNHPKYSVTSHSTYSPVCRQRIISSYPSIRWNSKIEGSSVEDSDVTTDHSLKCKCDNCRMKYCQSRNPSSKTLKPLKDNIMTFSDKETMTLKVRDAFCATCSTPSTPKNSNVSVTASSTRNLETESLNYNYCEPILKNQNSYKCERCGYKKEKKVETIHQPERDVERGYPEYVKPRSIKSIFKRRTDRPKEVEPARKTLYNEGIDDNVASRFPIASNVLPLPNAFTSDNSRVFIPSKSIPNRVNIPFVHNNPSKYHNDDKTFNHLKYEDNVELEELKHLEACPEVIRRSYTTKAVRYPKFTDIKLPRRVLTSVKDIDSYVDKSPRTRSGKGNK